MGKPDIYYRNAAKQWLIRAYAPTRYPEILGLEFRGYGKEQAQEALNLSREILNFIEEKIKTP